VLIGEKKNYLVALIVPNRTEVEKFASENGLSYRSYSELLKNQAVYEWLKGRLNSMTEGLAQYERIKYFALLDHELTLDAGELTPTFKVKRKFVTEKYRDVIESLYQMGKGYEDRDKSCS